jgi:hypothetical protein
MATLLESILNRPAFGFVDAILSKGGLFFERDRTDIFDSRGNRKCDQGSPSITTSPPTVQTVPSKTQHLAGIIPLIVTVARTVSPARTGTLNRRLCDT